MTKYFPEPAPVIEGVDPQLTDYIFRELNRISTSLFEEVNLNLAKIFVAPTRPQDGDILYADGVNFDPGGGPGIYAFINGSYQKLNDLASAAGITVATWTPTLTNTANLDASVASLSYYQRIGDQVNCWGGFTADPTAAANTLTTLEISLPIPSNLATIRQLIGVGASNVVQGPAIIFGSIANDSAVYSFFAGNAGNHTHSFKFSYVII